MNTQSMEAVELKVRIPEHQRDEIEDYCSSHSIPINTMMRMALQYVIKNNIKLV